MKERTSSIRILLVVLAMGSAAVTSSVMFNHPVAVADNSSGASPLVNVEVTFTHPSLRDSVTFQLAGGAMSFISFNPATGQGGTIQYINGDFDGDGKSDTAYILKNKIVLELSSLTPPNNFTSYSPSPDYDTSLGDWLVGDFDGNGKDDLAHIIKRHPEGKNNYIHLWLSKGEGDRTFDGFDVTKDELDKESRSPNYDNNCCRGQGWWSVGKKGKQATLEHHPDGNAFTHLWVWNPGPPGHLEMTQLHSELRKQNPVSAPSSPIKTGNAPARFPYASPEKASDCGGDCYCYCARTKQFYCTFKGPGTCIEACDRDFTCRP